jgi:hypothetical protein
MITGKTSTGFEFNIPDTVKDDYEVLEAMSALQKGADILQLPILLDRVLGKAQKDAFKEHCRVDGRVSSERMLQEFFEFFSTNSDTKKSQSSQV